MVQQAQHNRLPLIGVVLIVLLLSSKGVGAFTPPRLNTPMDTVKVPRTTNNIYWSSGERVGPRHKVTAAPKEILSVVTLKNGFASITLNQINTRGKRNVQPTAWDSSGVWIAPQLSDSTGTVNSYGWSVSNDGRLIIKSSDSTDNSTVKVRALTR